MAKLSVQEAAARLGVSPMRVRQRIHEGSLIAEKVGNRWLVDLNAVPATKRRGRPSDSSLIWDAIRRLDLAADLRHEDGRHVEDALRSAYAAQHGAVSNDQPVRPDLILPDGSVWEIKVGASSERRALRRLLEVAQSLQRSDEEPLAEMLLWLSHRADRRLYQAAGPDLEALRDDQRLLPSGLSHPRSGMQDVRIVEGYVAAADVDELVADYWLDAPGVDTVPNVVLHIAPGRPDEVTPVMLAADLAEHDNPRERTRARQLLVEALS